MERRPSRPRSLASMMPTVLKEVGLAPAELAMRVLEVWDRAIDPELAAVCRPEGIQRGVLVASVPDSAWMQRMQLERAHILDDLREHLGDDTPTQMRLRIRV